MLSAPPFLRQFSRATAMAMGSMSAPTICAVREGLRGGDGEDAGAGAEVEHAARFQRRGQPADGQEAALGRAVMRRAESAARIDLDGPLRNGAAAVVAAVNDEAAGMHGRQRLLRLGNPVHFGYGRHSQGHGRHTRICKHIRGRTGQRAIVIAFQEPAAALFENNEREAIEARRFFQNRARLHRFPLGGEFKDCF